MSNRAIATALGVDERTLRRDAAANAAQDGNNASEIKGGANAGTANAALSGAQAAAAVERAERKEQSAARAAERRQRSRSAEPLPNGMVLRIGDCRDVLAALVLTDPPYPAEAEPLYRWLAEWSARGLGGLRGCIWRSEPHNHAV